MDEKTKELLQRCLTYLADLNGMNWVNIAPDDYGKIDMKQRAMLLQKQLYTLLNHERIS